MRNVETDVVVVGAGNAGLVAALAAHESGARVIVLESANEAERGGNSRFAGGIFRTAHDGLESIEPLITEESRRWRDRVTVAPYSRERYTQDWLSTSQGRPDRELVATVINNSYQTLSWMRQHGVRFELTVDKIFDTKTLSAGQTYDMPPGGAIRAEHEGVGLMDRLFAAVAAAGIEVWYESPGASLLVSGSTVEGVRVRHRAEFVDVRGAVVLAAGGFESNPEMRLRYLGNGWDTVKVRGTRFNMGTMLTQALQVGAQPAGHWEGAHAAPIDAAGPPVGDLALTDKLSRYSYPYSLLVNVDGERFLDEGEDEVWLTYAKTGWAVRGQSRGVAHQIFDQKTAHLLEPRYSTATPVVGGSIAELAEKLSVPASSLERTVETYNAAVADDASERFDRFHLDGVAAAPVGQPPKSNWAQRIDQPPYTAYSVACGITFTYGGLRVDAQGRVLDTEGVPMPGLFATGEIIGNFFYYNYAAGAGLMRGAVFGRLAGAGAADYHRQGGA